jgi:hypothetical protein
MTDASRKPSRSWRLIARKIKRERDPERILMLVAELNRAMAVRGIERAHSAPKKRAMQTVWKDVEHDARSKGDRSSHPASRIRPRSITTDYYSTSGASSLPDRVLPFGESLQSNLANSSTNETTRRQEAATPFGSRRKGRVRTAKTLCVCFLSIRMSPSWSVESMNYEQKRRLQELRDELRRLMDEQVESLKAQTFGGITKEELRKEDERLKRIREVSADFLLALKNLR